MTKSKASHDEKEEKILKFITDFKNNNGFSPTIREICQAVNLKSTSSVHAYVKSLISRGLISSVPESPRTMEVNRDSYRDEYNGGLNIEPDSGPILVTFKLTKSAINIVDQ